MSESENATAGAKRILIVDDNPNDAELVVEALKGQKLDGEVELLRDGAEALDYLYRRGVFAGVGPGQPCVVLLDIKMPKVDGLEVLRQMKSDPLLRTVPVVMLTSSREERDVTRSYELNANGYVVKPLDFSEFTSAVEGVGRFWCIINEPPMESVGRSA